MELYLLNVLGNVICIFESRTMSLIYSLHALLESFIRDWFTVIVYSCHLYFVFRLTFVDRDEFVSA